MNSGIIDVFIYVFGIKYVIYYSHQRKDGCYEKYISSII